MFPFYGLTIKKANLQIQIYFLSLPSHFIYSLLLFLLSVLLYAFNLNLSLI